MGSFTQVCVWVYSRTCHAGSDCSCRQKSEGSLLSASRVRGPRTHGNGPTGHETPKATQMRCVGRPMKFENLTRRLADHWKHITATGRTDLAQIQVQADVCCGKVTPLHDSKHGVCVLKMKDARNCHCKLHSVPQGHIPQGIATVSRTVSHKGTYRKELPL